MGNVVFTEKDKLREQLAFNFNKQIFSFYSVNTILHSAYADSNFNTPILGESNIETIKIDGSALNNYIRGDVTLELNDKIVCIDAKSMTLTTKKYDSNGVYKLSRTYTPTVKDCWLKYLENNKVDYYMAYETNDIARFFNKSKLVSAIANCDIYDRRINLDSKYKPDECWMLFLDSFKNEAEETVIEYINNILRLLGL